MAKLFGENYSPPDLVAKMTGKAKYAEDFRAEGMLMTKLLMSPMPHARVRSVDDSAALALDGVYGILRASDFNPVEGPREAPLTDEPKYEGEPILAIAADAGGAEGQRANRHDERGKHENHEFAVVLEFLGRELAIVVPAEHKQQAADQRQQHHGRAGRPQ